ncbi:hypothetical protein [Ferrimonas gelatinilytica]|uniref:Lipid/polyisoprenoid-binding YceI-like domain-containing protein n=1 Tax=Ferrimonas gelatinilytica TaxID=1255257 RepID=A0ABP9RW36_9GAMM
MRNLIVSLVILFSFAVKADTDPCDVDSYPIKGEKVLHHAKSFSLPAIYYKQGNVRVIISKEKAIDFVNNNMTDSKAYLAKAKSHIINSLMNISDSEMVDQSSLQIPLEGLVSAELNVGIHVMAGYQGLFEGVLFNNEAVVEVDKKLVPETTATYMVGEDPQPIDEFKVVHKLKVVYKSSLVLENC